MNSKNFLQFGGGGGWSSSRTPLVECRLLGIMMLEHAPASKWVLGISTSANWLFVPPQDSNLVYLSWYFWRASTLVCRGQGMLMGWCPDSNASCLRQPARGVSDWLQLSRHPIDTTVLLGAALVESTRSTVTGTNDAYNKEYTTKGRISRNTRIISIEKELQYEYSSLEALHKPPGSPATALSAYVFSLVTFSTLISSGLWKNSSWPWPCRRSAFSTYQPI